MNERAMPPSDLVPDAIFQMSRGYDGTDTPMAAYREVDGALRRLKAVQQPDGRTFKDYVQQPDGEWAEVPSDEPGMLVLRGDGSSTVVDMDGDIMLPSALKSMAVSMFPEGLTDWQDKGMTTFREHKTDDDHLLGSIVARPTVEYRDPNNKGLIVPDSSYAGMNIVSDIETENADAVRTWRYVKKGRKLGWSVGVFFKDFEPNVNRQTGRVKGVTVSDAQCYEASSTFLPSNQQSWIDSTKAIRKSLLVRKGVLLPEETEEQARENAYRLLSAQDFPDPVRGQLEWLQSHMNQAGIYLCGRDA